MNTYDLHGRTAVITGGGSGIGLATAELFLKSGARVEIWGRDTAKLEEACRTLAPWGEVSWSSVDVSSWDAVREAGEATLRRLERVDILFNNAGHALRVGPMLEQEPEEWRASIGVNLDSAFYCCKVFAPQMIRNGYGRIINTSSVAGKEGNPMQAAYSAAKAGLIGMTKAFAKELAQTGVLVNAITPTVFDTPLVQATIAAAPGPMEASLAKIPMKRMGLPAEAAAMVAWLASEDCSFCTGVAFDLSGGRLTY